jgi:hypothetical protein
VAQALDCKPTRASSEGLQRGVAALSGARRLKAGETRRWLLASGFAVELPNGRLVPTPDGVEVGQALRVPT